MMCKSSLTPNVVPGDENSPIPCPLSRNNVTYKEGKKLCSEGRSKTVHRLVIKLKQDPHKKIVQSRVIVVVLCPNAD